MENGRFGHHPMKTWGRYVAPLPVGRSRHSPVGRQRDCDETGSLWSPWFHIADAIRESKTTFGNTSNKSSKTSQFLNSEFHFTNTSSIYISVYNQQLC